MFGYIRRSLVTCGLVVAALAAATTGIGGYVRGFPDSGERARIAVGKAIRRALAQIATADPVLGEYLRDGVHTGVRCSSWRSGAFEGR